MNNYFINTLLRSLVLRFFSAGLGLLLFSGNISAADTDIAWDASTSPNVGGYIVSYGQSSGNFTSNIDVGKVTAYTIAGLQEGQQYYSSVKAYDSNRTIESSYSNEIVFTVPVAEASLTVDFTASTTNGEAGMLVNFTPITTGTVSSWAWDLPGASTTTSTAQFASVSYPNPGTYTVTLTATGPSGNVTKTKAGLITVTEASTDTGTGTDTGTDTGADVNTSNAGLVAAFGFEEDNGTTVVDASGEGNHGIIKGATRITAGRYGKALKFDGIDNLVTVKHSASLDLSTGMTLEAWIYPQFLTTGAKTVIMKEKAGGAVYNLFSSADSDLPNSSFNDGSYNIISGSNPLPINQWTHLVATYDGQNQRLYVDGVEVAISAQNSLIESSNGVFNIGGNNIWDSYFEGYIDEVRIYNRALTEAEVNSNLATAINAPNSPSASNLSQFLLGNTNLEPLLGSKGKGIAQAFQTVAEISGAVTTVEVYLDAISTATQLVAGIYKDNNGHPGELISQGTLNQIVLGEWNSVTIPDADVIAGQPYWFAILGPDGDIGFLKQTGSGSGFMVRSLSYRLTELPGTWVSSYRGYETGVSMSIYGKGY